jgi:hypothetical protein
MASNSLLCFWLIPAHHFVGCFRLMCFTMQSIPNSQSLRYCLCLVSYDMPINVDSYSLPNFANNHKK